jgi:hypothetical protein
MSNGDAERVWYHTTKGRIVGTLVGDTNDPEWMRVCLTESAWADVRRRHLNEPGTVQAYRRTRMVEMTGPSKAGEQR